MKIKIRFKETKENTPDFGLIASNLIYIDYVYKVFWNWHINGYYPKPFPLLYPSQYKFYTLRTKESLKIESIIKKSPLEIILVVNGSIVAIWALMQMLMFFSDPSNRAKFARIFYTVEEEKDSDREIREEESIKVLEAELNEDFNRNNPYEKLFIEEVEVIDDN